MFEMPSMHNPFVKYSTLTEAQEMLDFEIRIPDTPKDYQLDLIQVMSNVMIEVKYRNQDSSIIYRMQETEKQIDGVYRKFDVIESEDIEGKTVIFKGDDKSCEVATWFDGTFTYALVCIKGIDKELFVSMIKSIK